MGTLSLINSKLISSEIYNTCGHLHFDQLIIHRVRSIPLLVVVAANGDVLDENAKKAIENCHSAASSSIKQYLKWAELYEKDEEVKQKTGILSSLKKALTKDSPEREQPPPQPNQEQELRESAESKVHKILLNERQNKEELLQKLQEKEDIIRHLQEVNQSLKHTNDELNTEIRTIKTTLEVSETRVRELEETTAQKKVEDAKFKEFLAVQGWLFKKGIKGPTANVYRKRYFRLDQGSKLYYYKSQSEGQPQGYIDLLKVVNVSAADSASQDKNNASFNIDCEGRTYQLQSYDQSDMKRWINALNYLKDYYRNKAAAK
jgi:predicted component of type VI protein secretion system